MSPQVEDWGYFDLASEQEIFQLHGKDVLSFLNKYFTQDVLRLPTPGAALGVFLTQKGKIVSEALVLKLKDQVLLIFPKGYGARVQQHLGIFLDLEEVEMEPAKLDFPHLVLLGSNLPGKLLASLSAEIKNQVKEFSFGELQGWCWSSDRFGTSGVEILLSKASSSHWPETLSQAGGRALSPEELEFFRIKAGLPKMGVDMGEENLVAEVGLDKRATSFTKGCYLGQETTARVNTQGHVNRQLTRLHLEKPIAASLPLEVFQGEKSVGKVTSAVQDREGRGLWALGILQTKAVQTGEPLRLAGGEPIEVVVGPTEDTK
jgi:folate-binding protein YgfZ